MCSCNSASSPCIDLGVSNLKVSALELVPNEPKFLRAVQTSPNIFMNVAKISLEGNMPSLFYGNGTNCWIFYGSWSKSYICSYLIVVLKTMAPSWAISNTPIDQTFAFSWEKLIVLDQT
jgi:hypothetical protein